METTLNKTHGMRHSPEYTAYCDAKARCTNPNHKNWLSYGGRGIKFRFSSFKQFFAEVGKRPIAKYKLDRENNNKGYAPGNVRWVTSSVSRTNQRYVKLTPNQVLSIRALYATGKFTYAELAKRFVTVTSNIGYIVRREQWKSV